MSKIKADIVETLAGANTSMANVVNGSAKAWVNFNGVGTVAIRAAHNVSSITDNGVGDYIINFTTAMPDANYCHAVGAVLNGSAVNLPYQQLSGKLAGSLRLSTYQIATGSADVDSVNAVIYR